VAGLSITAGGSGYTSAPTIGFSGGNGSGAAATANLTATSVAGLTVTNAGSGYTSAPTIALSGGAGSGAATTANLTPTTIAGLTKTAGGAGYTSAPTVSFSGGGGSGAAATTTITWKTDRSRLPAGRLSFMTGTVIVWKRRPADKRRFISTNIMRKTLLPGW
jgi:hypothetical protein